MADESVPDRSVDEVTTKLAAGDALGVDDIKFVLEYIPSTSDFGKLEVYRDDLNEHISGELGHAVYSSILHDFESAGVIDELRDDLIDTALDPEGFERFEGEGYTYYPSIRIGEEASEGVGSIHPPEKQPTTLWQIRKSIPDYLFCTGKGFHLDAEMIYDYETDYREFLRAVINCTNDLAGYEVTVECDEGERKTTIHVSLCSDKQSYHRTFKHGSDWLRFDAVDPVQAALDDAGSQRVRYNGGNDGWILVVDSETEELVEKYV